MNYYNFIHRDLNNVDNFKADDKSIKVFLKLYFGFRTYIKIKVF